MLKFVFAPILMAGTVGWLHKSPLSQAILLVLVSIWVGLVGLALINFWMTTIVVLVFSSGMMVMLLYMTSLTPGAGTPFSPPLLLIGMSNAVLYFSLLHGGGLTQPLSKMSAPYSVSFLPSLLILVLYLLFCLVVVMEYNQSFKGSLMKTKF